jgi:hypothetical protein
VDVAAFLGLPALALLPDFAFFAGLVAAAFTVAGLVAAVLDVAVLDVPALGAAARAVVVPAPADRSFAASLSAATALSSALVAAVMAASALVSVLADAPARDAAMVSRAVADVTRVAAADTVRGVAAFGPLADVGLAVALLAVARVLVVRALAAGLAVALAVGLLAFPVVPLAPVVPGSVAAVFVGTDLHPHLVSSGGWHSTESNVLHAITRKNIRKPGIKVTESYFSPCGRSPATMRSASSGDAPRPTATPIR